MTKSDLVSLKRWFSAYTASYHSPDTEDQKNISLKIVHTKNVCDNISRIALSIGMSAAEVMLAEAVALFHDVGRFPQYASYGTFRDSESVNHGVLGADTLVQDGVLKELPRHEQTVIVQAVRYHNVLSLPAIRDRDVVCYLKLIRDADKLDALRIFSEYYESGDESRASATVFGLPESPRYSRGVLSKIHSKSLITYAELVTVNDFKLLNLSWAFRLNFPGTYRLLKERGYLKRIVAQLPEAEEVQNAASSVQRFVDEKVNEEY